MPPFVGVTVEFCREPAVGLGRNDDRYPGTGQPIAQPIRVKRAVGKEVTAVQSLDQRSRAAQVMGLSGQQPEVDQIAKRVGQGHDLAGYTATRAPDGLALSPPFAPCP